MNLSGGVHYIIIILIECDMKGMCSYLAHIYSKLHALYHVYTMNCSELHVLYVRIVCIMLITIDYTNYIYMDWVFGCTIKMWRKISTTKWEI